MDAVSCSLLCGWLHHTRDHVTTANTHVPEQPVWLAGDVLVPAQHAMPVN